MLSLVDQSLHASGGVTYDATERTFAERLRTTLSGPLPPLSMTEEIRPVRTALVSASTDVGDVSWVTPTGQFFAATFVPGVPLHSWQSTACAGMSIGQKGMLVAAKTLALSAIELFSDPAKVSAAQAAFTKARAGREYTSLLPAGAKPLAR